MVFESLRPNFFLVTLECNALKGYLSDVYCGGCFVAIDVKASLC